MKILHVFKGLFLVLLVVAIQGCNKKEDLLAEDSLDQAASSSEILNITNETDRVFEDINKLVSSSRISGARLEEGLAIDLPCGASVDSTEKAKRKLVLNFNEEIPCREGTVVRSGSIVIQFGDSLTRWRDKGSVVEATFINYKVKSISTNNYITLNGTKTVTNESGGLIRLLPLSPSVAIIHKISASLVIDFGGAYTKTWQLSQKRKTTVSAITISGDGQYNGEDKVRIQGVNRNGHTFYTTVPQDIIIPNCNDTYKPISGKTVNYTLKSDKTEQLEITYGVKSNGTPASGCFELYGYKLNWKNDKNQAKEIVVAY